MLNYCLELVEVARQAEATRMLAVPVRSEERLRLPWHIRIIPAIRIRHPDKPG
ncbi:hypothetical protein ACFQOZ_19710 [Comamonas endophytica]|uniref:hypothetical protein n=1 Tax=Comamonas endophytica TaxID=2949090 RepID=UPI003606B5B8